MERLAFIGYVAGFFLSAHPGFCADDGSGAFFEGKAALEHGDCPAAVEALESVSGNLRQDTRWMRLVAKAHGCSGNLERSLKYWEKLEELSPGEASIQEALGDVRYRIKRKAAQERMDRCIERCKESTSLCIERARTELDSTHCDMDSERWYSCNDERGRKYDRDVATCGADRTECEKECRED